MNVVHLDLTRNLKYDRLTSLIMKMVLKSDSNCIDIGCHEGEMLDLILKYAPKGQHFAFEPIPSLFLRLEDQNQVRIFPYALSSQKGKSIFHFVKNAPAYSGLRRRDYQTSNPDIEEIEVQLEKLDDVISPNQGIDFIKLDVEGAELQVLQGALQTIRKNKPTILFEFGLGASNHYGTSPADIWQILVEDCQLRIYTLDNFIREKSALTFSDFEMHYQSNTEYYFVASATTPA